MLSNCVLSTEYLLCYHRISYHPPSLSFSRSLHVTVFPSLFICPYPSLRIVLLISISYYFCHASISLSPFLSLCKSRSRFPMLLFYFFLSISLILPPFLISISSFFFDPSLLSSILLSSTSFYLPSSLFPLSFSSSPSPTASLSSSLPPSLCLSLCLFPLPTLSPYFSPLPLLLSLSCFTFFLYLYLLFPYCTCFSLLTSLAACDLTTSLSFSLQISPVLYFHSFCRFLFYLFFKLLSLPLPSLFGALYLYEYIILIFRAACAVITSLRPPLSLVSAVLLLCHVGVRIRSHYADLSKDLSV